MALIGSTTAIVSLGAACQTASQLSWHRLYVPLLRREYMEFQSSLFNWLFCDIHDLALFIETMADRPITAEHIDDSVHGRMQFRGFKVWLVHEDQTAEIAASKYNHLAQKFWALRGKRRRYFIIGNSQNSIALHFAELGDTVMTPANIARLRAALDTAFPEGENILLPVCYREATTLPPGAYYEMPRDDTLWEGRGHNWRRFFNRHLGREIGWFEWVRRRRRIVGRQSAPLR